MQNRILFECPFCNGSRVVSLLALVSHPIKREAAKSKLSSVSFLLHIATVVCAVNENFDF